MPPTLTELVVAYWSHLWLSALPSSLKILHIATLDLAPPHTRLTDVHVPENYASGDMPVPTRLQFPEGLESLKISTRVQGPSRETRNNLKTLPFDFFGPMPRLKELYVYDSISIYWRMLTLLSPTVRDIQLSLTGFQEDSSLDVFKASINPRWLIVRLLIDNEDAKVVLAANWPLDAELQNLGFAASKVGPPRIQEAVRVSYICPHPSMSNSLSK